MTVSERAARDIKPRLGEVTDDIRDRIAGEPAVPSPERTREIVAEVIDDHRDQIADARRERDANSGCHCTWERTGESAGRADV